jgi:hypothetical protein
MKINGPTRLSFVETSAIVDLDDSFTDVQRPMEFEPRAGPHTAWQRDGRQEAAALGVSASSDVRRSMSCIQEQPREGVRPNAKEKWPDQILEYAFGLPEVLVAVSAIQLGEVEGAEKDASVSALVPDEIERGDAVVIAGDSFAVDNAGARAKACQRLDDQREAVKSLPGRL